MLPEDKYRLVKALQKNGHLVGMCGDGANDAPALRQAQMGIAVFTATDVAKSAAGIVLTEPGLGGIVTSIKEGRRTFGTSLFLQHSIDRAQNPLRNSLFLGVGLLVRNGYAILTPTDYGGADDGDGSDFLAMSSSTDNVRPSPKPDTWRIRNLTIAGIVLGLVDLIFCVSCLAVGKFVLGLDTETLRTLTVITLVFSGQALFYVSRERRHL